MALHFNPKAAIGHIKACYYAAKQYPSLYEEGLYWYFDAQRIAGDMARRNRVSLQSAVGVIAALSPNNKWKRNLIDAENCLKVVAAGGWDSDFKASTYGQNKLKAWWIASEKSPDEILGGNKVRSFYANILVPDDPFTVTIDGHAVAIALGARIPLSKSPQLSDKQYEAVAEAYRQATVEINADSLTKSDLLPSQVQAVTWTYYRFLHSLN